MRRHIGRGADAIVTGSIAYRSIARSNRSDWLYTTLPAYAAERIESEMDAARQSDLPAGALEYRALQLAAKGVSPTAIIEDVAALHRALQYARVALRLGRRVAPATHEIEAASTLLRQGISADVVRTLAASVPTGRSVGVPLIAVTNLMNRGLPAPDVIAAMHVWLAGDASDTELQDLTGPEQRTELTVVR